MSNIEHLIENALVAMAEKPIDTYQAFTEAMSARHNKQMLEAVSITIEELWAIAQYVFYTWEKEPVRGRWKERFNMVGRLVWDCSECDATSLEHGLYCPHCGAKIDLEAKDGQ